MKTKVIFQLLIALSTSFCFAQLKTDVQKNFLNGKVKSMTEFTYSAVKKNGEIKKRGLIGRKTMVFNENGYLLETKEVGGGAYIEPESDDEIIVMDSTIGSYQLYKYDNDGFLVKILSYELNGLSRGFITFQNDPKGNVICKSSRNSDGTPNIYDFMHIYNYDTNGKMVEEKLLDGNNQLTCKKTFFYNDRGILDLEVSKFAEDNIMKIRYFYDNNGKKIEEENLDKFNNTVNKYVYGYDENGRLYSETEYDSHGKMGTGMGPLHKYHKYDLYGNEIEFINTSTSDNSINDKTRKVFKYDNKFNWIQSIRFFQYLSNPEKVEEIIERIITYY